MYVTPPALSPPPYIATAITQGYFSTIDSRPFVRLVCVRESTGASVCVLCYVRKCPSQV